MDGLGMHFSLSSLAASFIFGVFGIYLFRHGKKKAHAPALLIGIALMIYPYFIENVFLLWGIGIVLLALAYKLLKPNF